MTHWNTATIQSEKHFILAVINCVSDVYVVEQTLLLAPKAIKANLFENNVLRTPIAPELQFQSPGYPETDLDIVPMFSFVQNI